MKTILIVDDMRPRRDPARFETYSVMVHNMGAHICLPENMFQALAQHQYDVLWLSMYHLTYGINWLQLVGTYRGRIVLDQADNEEYNSLRELISLLRDYQDKVLLSRYLPNEAIQECAAWLNCPVKLLPWYLDRESCKPQHKEFKFAFVCTLYGKRLQWADVLRRFAIDHDLNALWQPVRGQLYPAIIGASEVMVVESSRRALTLKYLEAAMSGCRIVGHQPMFPVNDVQGFWVEKPGQLTDAILEALESPLPDNSAFIARHTDPELLIQTIKEIIG